MTFSVGDKVSITTRGGGKTVQHEGVIHAYVASGVNADDFLPKGIGYDNIKYAKGVSKDDRYMIAVPLKGSKKVNLYYCVPVYTISRV